jgi:hypothetical protein
MMDDRRLTTRTDVLYDMVHYFSHHMRVSEGYLADMKKYHLAHHYQSESCSHSLFVIFISVRSCLLTITFLSLCFIRARAGLQTSTSGTVLPPSSGITSSGPSYPWKSSRPGFRGVRISPHSLFSPLPFPFLALEPGAYTFVIRIIMCYTVPFFRLMWCVVSDLLYAVLRRDQIEVGRAQVRRAPFRPSSAFGSGARSL